MTLCPVGAEFYTDDQTHRRDKANSCFLQFCECTKKINSSNEYQTSCFDLKVLFLLFDSILDTVLFYRWLDIVLTLNSCVQRSFLL